MPTSRPTGLRDFTPSDTDIAVSAVLSPPSVPKEGGTHFTTGMGLLGNGDWGDCYWASRAREGRTLSKIAGRNRNFTEPPTVATYVAYLGLKSVADLNEQTDQGTDAREGAKFSTTHGSLDENNKPMYIGAYAFESDPEKLPAQIAALGVGTVCIELLEGCEEEFNEAEKQNRPFVWDVSNGGQVAGGHAITGHYWTPDGIGVTSWDREGIITWDYLAKYMQTTVVYFSAAQLGPAGTAPDGLDKQKLLDLIHEVTS